jgi:hypothetical protein
MALKDWERAYDKWVESVMEDMDEDEIDRKTFVCDGCDNRRPFLPSIEIKEAVLYHSFSDPTEVNHPLRYCELCLDDLSIGEVFGIDASEGLREEEKDQ